MQKPVVYITHLIIGQAKFCGEKFTGSSQTQVEVMLDGAHASRV
jgi:hypothetical protein